MKEKTRIDMAYDELQKLLKQSQRGVKIDVNQAMKDKRFSPFEIHEAMARVIQNRKMEFRKQALLVYTSILPLITKKTHTA
ncbi:MAG: hypothetical protein V1838_05075 [Patescibacteria group bacterium]